jgi:malate dehydrogenase (oxaloacetate-decarboxylating)
MSQETIALSLFPEEILNLPLLNKGTAFTQEERDELGLNGFLPSHITTVDDQIARVKGNLERARTPLAKYIHLLEILNRNELLFYQLLSRYPEEYLPIIYTPTVGEAAIKYSEIFYQQRGLYLSYPLIDRIDEILARFPHKDIQAIVVTDGERILGLGDQGIGGIVIPIGKLSLYTLFGGIHPAKTLPIILDVGTNNPALQNDKLYLGWRHPRLSGAKYDRFIEAFVRAVKKNCPNALLQWEDFGKENARRLLDKYRDQLLSFNDDIQGTASVTLAALLAASKSANTQIKQQRIAIFGGGSAGTGIADALCLAMQAEGMSREEAAGQIYIIDIDGLIHFNTPHIYDAQKPYVKSQAALKNWKLVNPAQISMMDVVQNLHPTILIGVSGQTGAFTKEMIEAMAAKTAHPIIFPLSNPTSKAEATPQELIEWTKGKAIIATGSPFLPVEFEGKTFQIGQCNNVYVFPGVGTGALAARASKVTDAMFLEASKTLAAHSPALKDKTASLFPPISDVRRVSRAIAIAVAKKAIEEKVSRISVSEVEARIDAVMWTPHYPRYVKKDKA